MVQRDRQEGGLFAVQLEASVTKRIVSNFHGESRIEWSADGRRLFVSISISPAVFGNIGRTYVVPLAAGEMWPPIPPGGLRSLDDFAKFPGAQVIKAYDVAPDRTSGVYALSRSSVQRNLYRVPIP